MNDDILKNEPRSTDGDMSDALDTPAAVHSSAAQEVPPETGSVEESTESGLNAVPSNVAPSGEETESIPDAEDQTDNIRAEGIPDPLAPEEATEIAPGQGAPDIVANQGAEVFFYGSGAIPEGSQEPASAPEGKAEAADPDEELPDGEAAAEVTPTIHRTPAPEEPSAKPEPATAAEEAPKPFFLRRRARADEDRAYDPEHPRRVDGRFDFVELFIFVLCAVLVLTSFFFRHSVVDGGSMEGTLYEGDHLIISDCFYTPAYGDIIVVEDYGTHLNRPIVKRVIALGGDTVRITADGRVYRNGELLTEDYVYIDIPYYRYTPMEYTVPQGEIFVMGDHRNSSLDSREFGSVREETVLGKVLFRFYPFRSFGRVS